MSTQINSVSYEKHKYLEVKHHYKLHTICCLLKIQENQLQKLRAQSENSVILSSSAIKEIFNEYLLYARHVS